MKISKWLLLFVLNLLLTLQQGLSKDTEIIDLLLQRLFELQWQETKPYIPSDFIIPKQQFQVGGLFQSTIHNNDVGNNYKQRENTIIYDNNFFVTTWIIQMLFEATEFNLINQNNTNLINQFINATYIALNGLYSFFLRFFVLCMEVVSRVVFQLRMCVINFFFVCCNTLFFLGLIFFFLI